VLKTPRRLQLKMKETKKSMRIVVLLEENDMMVSV
jgi:hypothetical protein